MSEITENKNPVVALSFKFALQTMAYCNQLELRKHYVMARQLMRCGTSIGANIREAQQAESRNDFIHKFKNAAKEAEETAYWLELMHHSEGYPDCSLLRNLLQEILRLINRIIYSAKNPKSGK